MFIEAVHSNAMVKKITINSLTPGSLSVFADPDMLKTVLRNLLSNAIKFTKPGGVIEIAATTSRENITITVSDNGTGMSQETLKKLFDITQIVTTRGTANENGTGLGLLLCKEFVLKHGGFIWAESEEGKGSTFTFTLPA